VKGEGNFLKSLFLARTRARVTAEVRKSQFIFISEIQPILKQGAKMQIMTAESPRPPADAHWRKNGHRFLKNAHRLRENAHRFSTAKRWLAGGQALAGDGQPSLVR